MRGSLRLRLMVAAAVAILMALIGSWFALSWIFDRHIERREAHELTRHGLTLVSGLTLDAAGRPEVGKAPDDARFVDPAGGFYWQVSYGPNAVRSRSLWDQSLPAPAARADAWNARSAAGPHGGRVLLVERLVRPTEPGPLVAVQLAIDDGPLRTASAEFGREIAISLAVLGLILTAATYVQIRLGLQPLGRVEGELQRMQRSPSARLAESQPTEIRPLATAINSLADARESDLRRARQRAADLAHGLKTPLAAMAAQSRRAREAGAVDAADGLDRAAAAMAATLEAELARARAAAARVDGQASVTTAARVAEQVIAVVERTEQGERLIFENLLPSDLGVPVRSPELTEIIGALVENAAKYARTRVRIDAHHRGGGVGIRIEDDGPGMSADRLEAALMRGARLDEIGPGHGLGLAIVRDLVAATDGDLELGASQLGGLKVEIAWKGVRQA